MAHTGEVYLDVEAGMALDLPLLGSELVYIVAPSQRHALGQLERAPQALIRERPLESGEQYRFHFDMTKCIGCKCGVVACNEQNGHPAAINWRRVATLYSALPNQRISNAVCGPRGRSAQRGPGISRESRLR